MAALTASLNELRTTFETQARETHELIRGSPALSGEGLRNARRRNTTVRWESLASLEQSWRTDARAADRSQYFQTAQDLLEEYGPPSAIYRPQGGLLFVYRRHPEGAAGTAWYFRLQDGFVVEFWVEEEELEGD